MKTILQTASLLLIAGVLIAAQNYPSMNLLAGADPVTISEAPDQPIDVHPKLVRISGMFDGSGRIVFTRAKAHYEHKHWARPTNVQFDSEPWTDLNQTPAPWTDYSLRLDLTRASIVKRVGRDLIALEATPDGFDLYINDSPNGSGKYEVVIAIPRRN